MKGPSMDSLLGREEHGEVARRLAGEAHAPRLEGLGQSPKQA